MRAHSGNFLPHWCSAAEPLQVFGARWLWAALNKLLFRKSLQATGTGVSGASCARQIGGEDILNWPSHRGRLEVLLKMVTFWPKIEDK